MDVVSACYIYIYIYIVWIIFATYRFGEFEVEVFISALFHSNEIFFFFCNIQM
jgi:hypothetical protein